MVPFPVSHDVDIRQKSKMAIAKMKYKYITDVDIFGTDVSLSK